MPDRAGRRNKWAEIAGFLPASPALPTIATMRQERRRTRSDDAGEAMRFQLDAARMAAGCDAMVLADEDGLCVAAAGGLPHDEIAAYSAILGNKVENFEGILYSKDRRWSVRIRRFSAEGARLILCAVGGGSEARAEQLHRSVGGVSRILATA
jgi:hypothetical protein